MRAEAAADFASLLEREFRRTLPAALAAFLLVTSLFDLLDAISNSLVMVNGIGIVGHKMNRVKHIVFLILMRCNILINRAVEFGGLADFYWSLEA